jgi:hypothetical protein
MHPAFVKYGPAGLLLGAFALIAYSLLSDEKKESKGGNIATGGVALLPQPAPAPSPAPAPAPDPEPLKEQPS